MRHEVIGLNYIDTYHRTGLYKIPLPSGIGSEGRWHRRSRRARRHGVQGGRSRELRERNAAPAGRQLRRGAQRPRGARRQDLPDGITFEQAAAMMLKGMTVQYLLKRTYKVKAGETVLFHAAAGGVGLIACQWLKALGVTMIGTAGSDEKCALAKAHGAAHCINYNKEDFVARVKEITGGKGVPVVYDGIGKDTFDRGLECLSPFGMMVTFGNASGSVPPVDLGKLKGTLYVTRPSLPPYTTPRESLVATANDLFDIVKSGKVKIDINQRYPLKDAVQAHRDLESRKTTGIYCVRTEGLIAMSARARRSRSH